MVERRVGGFDTRAAEPASLHSQPVTSGQLLSPVILSFFTSTMGVTTHQPLVLTRIKGEEVYGALSARSGVCLREP